MRKHSMRTTLRIDDKFKTMIKLLAIKNNVSFNTMITYLIEIGYNAYLKDFDNYYMEENKKLKER